MKKVDRTRVSWKPLETLVDALTTRLHRPEIDVYTDDPKPTQHLGRARVREGALIVSRGKIVKVEAGQFKFERSADQPTQVFLTCGNVELALPANKQEMERVMAAYRRVCEEDVQFTKSEEVSP